MAHHGELKCLVFLGRRQQPGNKCYKFNIFYYLDKNQKQIEFLS